MSAATTEPAARSAADVAETRTRPFLHAVRGTLLPFWMSRASRRCRLLIPVIGLCIFVDVRLAVWINGHLGEISQATLDRNTGQIVSVLRGVVWLVASLVVVEVVTGYLKQFVVIDWRRWLTGRFQHAWLDGDRFYHLERQGRVDNADQRIAEDVYLAINQAVPMVVDLVNRVAQIVGFSAILWTVGGAVSLAPVGLPWRVPHGYFWAAIAYQMIGSIVLLAVGYPLIALTVARQKKEADYRFALAAIRGNAEQIALYEGERPEAMRLDRRFAEVVANWHAVMRYNAWLKALGDFHNTSSMTLSLLLAWQKFFAGDIAYGQIMVVSAAFLRVSFGLHWVMQWIGSGEIYAWAAAVRRLDAFERMLARPVAGGLAVDDGAPAGAMLACHALVLARPEGGVLATIGDLRFAGGERWLVQGPSGAGKSTLMRALAGLWPHGSGTVRRDPAVKILFVPQKNYLPRGTLADALCYPSPPGAFSRAACVAALDAVRLEALAPRLDEAAAWQDRLSPGEQQRLAFARVLLQRPDILLLDEATSALDQDDEAHLYALVDRTLPDAAIVSIAHRDTLACFHPNHIAVGVVVTIQVPADR